MQNSSNRFILCPNSALNLQRTLFGGQSFRWINLAESSVLKEQDEAEDVTKADNEYISIVSNWIFKLGHSLDGVYAKAYRLDGSKVQNTDTEELEKSRNCLYSYFNLSHDLDTLYSQWRKDSVFDRVVGVSEVGSYRGIRLLAIDPAENIFSFLISQNNNIPRITKLVDALCCTFGRFCVDIGDIPIYSFPTAEDLAQVDEMKLRSLGFGYRSKFIVSTAKQLVSKSKSLGFPTVSSFLAHLKAEKSYDEVKMELLELTGIGPKVADCISLFGMGKLEAVPVDTHVRAIAERLYGYKQRNSSMTPKDYAAIQEIFTCRFGEFAGWAHSILFIADLKWRQVSQDDENQANGAKKKRKTTKPTVE